MNATYTKLNSGEWGVRVPVELGLKEGAVVAITKKDGTVKDEVIAKVLWEGNGIRLCSIRKEEHRTNRYRRSSTAPGGRKCPMCGSRECAKAWNPRDLCDED